MPVATVSSQAKIWIVDGITTIIDAAAKKTSVDRRQAGREHVVRPDAEADERDEQLGERDERERDHPPPRERRDDRGRDPERGQDDDVDLGVAEDPEQVLPEQRVAAVRDVEEVEAELALELEEDAGRASAAAARTAARTTTASIAKQKSGIRFSDMPGARSLKIVTMKLIAAAVDEMPLKIRPSA